MGGAKQGGQDSKYVRQVAYLIPAGRSVSGLQLTESSGVCDDVCAWDNEQQLSITPRSPTIQQSKHIDFTLPKRLRVAWL